MVFSSPEFLFLFMPVFFSVYYATRADYRNLLILTASLIFYAVAAGYITIILLGSILVNHFIAQAMGEDGPANRRLLIVGVACNLAPLVFFKYMDFLLRTVHDGLGFVGARYEFGLPQFLLPIGISFYTFHGIFISGGRL